MKSRPRHIVDPDTVRRLSEVRDGLPYRKLAVRLGYAENAAGMLSDVLSGQPGKVTEETENELRRRLSLPPILHVEARPCPTCLAQGHTVVHGDALDCGGQPIGSIIVVRPWQNAVVKNQKPKRSGKRLYSDEQKRRKERLGLTWSQIIEWGLQAAEEQMGGPSYSEEDHNV